jgi:hypothetical protein
MLGLIAGLAMTTAAHGLDISRMRDGDWMVVSAEMSHSTEAIRALLKQDSKTMSLGKGVRSVKAEALPNGCTKVQVENDGLGRAYSYTAERCAIQNGWHSKMIESPDFKDHQIIWTTVPSGTGSRITIRVKVELKLPIPRFLTNRIVSGALEETLNKIDVQLTN